MIYQHSQHQPPHNSFPGSDDITRVELSNGIVVLARPNYNSPSVVFTGYLHAGSLFDPQDQLGLADFTASSLLLGTQQYDYATIYDKLESAAASLNFEGGAHVTSFGGRCLAEDFEMLCTLFTSALRFPIFPADHVERKRSQIITGLILRSQDTSEMASLTLDEIIYANHPYRYPSEGYIETVQNISLESLNAFHKKNYGPRGMVIVVVGAIEPQKAVEMIAQHLGDWENPQQPSPAELPPVTPLTALTRQDVHISGKSQADIMLGTIGPLRKSPDYMAAALGNSILGQFGMMGRIGDIVREKEGLAYYAFSSLSAGIGPGSWTFSAGVAPHNVEKAIHLIQQEIRRFVTEKVTTEELQDSQANFIGRLPLSLESNLGVAFAIRNLEKFDLGLDYYRIYADLVRAVTVDQVLETAQRYLDPDRLAVAVAGSLDQS
ncbi:MAG: M16 family metallopeptidase [Chloroflexota bacterium]